MHIYWPVDPRRFGIPIKERTGTNLNGNFGHTVEQTTGPFVRVAFNYRREVILAEQSLAQIGVLRVRCDHSFSPMFATERIESALGDGVLFIIN